MDVTLQLQIISILMVIIGALDFCCLAAGTRNWPQMTMLFAWDEPA